METNHTVAIATMLQRVDALRTARDILKVKGGKYAERPLDEFALVFVADYILYGYAEHIDMSDEVLARIDAAIVNAPNLRIVKDDEK